MGNTTYMSKSGRLIQAGRITKNAKTQVVGINVRYMNRISGTDVLPYEIVEVVNEKTVKIRPMMTTQAADWKPEMVAGGFSAHCTNNDTQRWDIVSMDGMLGFEGFIETTLVKQRKNGKWYGEGGVEYTPSVVPIKFYDFNF